MKMTKIKLTLVALLFASFTAATAFAQNARLQIDHLDTLFPKAVETIDVRVDGSLLQIASKFLDKSKTNEAQVREILNVLKGVYVKGVEFDKEGEYTEQDVEAVRQQLRTPGWERIVGVRSKRGGENAEVYLKSDGNGITGLAVIAAEARELTIVQIIGAIQPEDLRDLGGHFGVPRMEFGRRPDKED